MKIYAKLDRNTIIGFYIEGINKNIPISECVELTQEQYDRALQYLNDDQNYTAKYINGEVERHEKIRTLDEVKLFKKNSIDLSCQNSINVGATLILNSGKVFHMDADFADAAKLKSGIDLAQMLGETTMNIVDYENKVHLGLPLVEALELVQLQAKYYRDQWSKRAILRNVIDKAKTKEEVNNISW